MIATDMIYLLFCALHGQIPNTSKIVEMDLEQLWKLSKFHSVSAMIAYALESAGIQDKNFQQEKNNAIRKMILLDAERENICDFFEKNHIWYMPLKGVYLKTLYPKIGMRQMCDNDILVDASRMQEIDDFLQARGYHLHSSKSANDYGYLKEPCYNFEIHRSLFGIHHEEKFYNYYKAIQKQLRKDEENSYGYHFSQEDFYIYMIAHAYKHFQSGGTGLRSLVDTFVFVSKFDEILNWKYIAGECRKLGLTEFEKENRNLAMKLFSQVEVPTLTATEQATLQYYFVSGTYGTVRNATENRMMEYNSKSSYILHRIFPPMETYRKYYPFFYRHKILLPIAWGYRLIRGVFVRREKLQAEIRTVKSK